MILAVRTDGPTAELWIVAPGGRKLVNDTWEAGQELSSQLLKKVKANCDKISISLKEIKAIVVYEGPGSYTGLRIGISAMNALGYAFSIPVIGRGGNRWLEDGLEALRHEQQFNPALPVYGGTVYTTKPKK